MKKTLTYLIVIIALASCKKEVTSKIDQDKIFTQFRLSYNENTDITTAKATFRFSNANGTKLQLSDPSTVTVDGAELEWSESEGFYSKELSGFVPQVEFYWVDIDGNGFTNTANIRDIAFSNETIDWSYSDSINFYELPIAGLDSNESVTLTLFGPGDTDDRTFSIDTLGATTITIDSVRLSQVDSGMVTVALEMIYSPELIEGTSKGGTLIGTYRPVDQSFNLE